MRKQTTFDGKKPIKCFYAILVIVAFQISSSAAEVLMYDSTFTVTEEHHGFFYFKPRASSGGNWLSPIDYFNGKWCNRFEVLSCPPSSQNLNLSTCIWADVVGNWSSWKEQCGGLNSTPRPGVYEQISSPSSWWTLNQPVDFSRVSDFRDCGVVLWCGGQNMSDWVSGGCWDQRSNYLPLRMRLTVVLVSAGSTFGGWARYVGSVKSTNK